MDSTIWSSIPSYGELIEIDNFINDVKFKLFTSLDGSGYYAEKDRISNVEVSFNITLLQMHKKNFTHVIWFNK